MKRSDRFWTVLESKSAYRTTAEKKTRCLVQWKLKKVIRLEGKCICGQRIKSRYYIRNVSNGNVLVVGKCCARRLGIALHYRSKADYLNSALMFAKNEWEVSFVRSLLDRCVKWGRKLIISNRQAAILERITGKKWRYKTWERVIAEKL